MFLVVLVMVGLLWLYATRYREHSPDVWSAPAAWSRACIYFCFCLLVADLSGALQATRLSDGSLAWERRLPDSCWASPL